jgi:hypothetical protein
MSLMVNEMLTRGPLSGCHVSPWRWLKTYAVGYIRPRDLWAGVKTWEGQPNQCTTICFLLYIWKNIYLNLHCVAMGARSEPGLSPGPRSYTLQCNHRRGMFNHSPFRMSPGIMCMQFDHGRAFLTV